MSVTQLPWLHRYRGQRFLKEIRKAEERCAKETWGTLPKTGERTPRSLSALGDLLRLTYSASSCSWGCAGSDHTANYLAGRVATLTSASLRCLSAGYYDESLVLARSVGELANLLLLFARYPDEYVRWKTTTPKERRQAFSPVNVRMSLEQALDFVPVDHVRYEALSEMGVHVTPDTIPQAHNPARRAVLGHIFQLPGGIMALTELCIATSVAAHSVSKLMNIPMGVRDDFDACARELIDALPNIDILSIPKLLRSLAREPSQE